MKGTVHNDWDHRPRLFGEEINIIYDGKCNVCKFEIEGLSKRDQEVNAVPYKIKITNLEDPLYDPNSPQNGNVTYGEGMAAIHAVTHDGKVLNGVEVFRLAYKLVGLGWLWELTKWPILEPMVKFGYDVFAKYRTQLTRGSSMEALIQAYHEKRTSLEQQQRGDCQSCQRE